MPTFFTAGHLRLSLLLSVLGALIALISTIFSDSGMVAMIFRPLVSALLMFVLGTILYTLLVKKVPEAIDVIENRVDENIDMMPEGDMSGAEANDIGMAGADENFASEGKSSPASYDSDYSSGGGGAASNIPRKTGVQIGKEEIIVNGVKFKNQPEVMAETIKQLMEQDKE